VRKKLGLPSPFDIRFGNPLDLQAIAVAYPSVPIIIPHFGAGLFREALMLADLCPNVIFDTSSSNGWIKYLPGLTLEAVFRQALAVVGADRLLFGSNALDGKRKKCSSSRHPSWLRWRARVTIW
jgi:predicted TIM-barrel fold metal-dependent hydrolase